MSVSPCEHCNHPVSPLAAACPGCGATPLPGRAVELLQLMTGLAWTCVLLWVLVFGLMCVVALTGPALREFFTVLHAAGASVAPVG